MNKIVLVVLAGISSLTLLAKENVGTSGSNSQSSLARVAADCTPSQAMTDLNINNVRTTIMGGGDMWWNLSDARYEIPKNSNKHSMFAGALWIAGIDAGEQLKAAAMTYRQTGNDFWTGPLDDNGDISSETCDDYDKHFSITRQEVDEFIAWYNDNSAYPNYTVPLSIINWPGNGIDGDYQFLAPYYDANDDGEYDPNDGDYPKYDIDGNLDCNEDDLIYGDQTLYWIFNDKGNIHSETGADPIGLEIRAQAFAFATNDEINNMTFYNYKIINKATIQLNDAYFGQWVDPDLGKYDDDYVGCDVARGFGYCYNGDDNDEGATGYGTTPPAIGVDFFQGPLADIDDGIDNDRDSIIDEPGEQAIMSRFVYYNNDFTVTGNPENGQHIYNYLVGKWKDGLDITYGSTGRGGSTPAKFMFPGDTDPYGWGTDGLITSADWDEPDGWTEKNSGNDPADRRFVQSAGPFTLEPGAVNRITTGVVWARATAGDNLASVELIRLADDKAQALFDNCFQVLNGPDTPDVGIIELDQELVLNLSNGTTSNNFLEEYIEFDPLIISPPGQTWDPYFRFQGYQIYQLASVAVSVTDLDNPDLARLVYQCDIEDTVENLINYNFDVSIGANVPTLEVSATNNGIQHSISITEDQFSLGNKTLVNNQAYYFMSVAYGYNKYKDYDPTNPNKLDGQQKPYKAGRKNIKVYTGIPHKPFTTQLNASVGDGVELKRILGAGNGSFELALTEETENEILTSATHSSAEPVYQASLGPVDVQVVDPRYLTQSEFALKMYGELYNASSSDPRHIVLDQNKSKWELVNLNTNESMVADATIGDGNQQLFTNFGFSVEVNQENPPAWDYLNNVANYDESNRLISSSIEFADEYNPWLGGVRDVDEEDGEVSVSNTFLWGRNWIHAGSYSTATHPVFNDIDGDPDGVFEDVVNGTWAPYRLVSPYLDGPGYTIDQNFSNTSYSIPQSQSGNRMRNLQSVKVVITDDNTKWSRCVVLESQDSPVFAKGGAAKLDLRTDESVGKDGSPDGTGTGMGWFPGYAINKETGERLNIMFAEDSWLSSDNGDDMVWNPSTRLQTQIPTWANGSYYLGGKHFIYVHSSKYDGCEQAKLDLASPSSKLSFFRNMMWTSVPMLNEGYDLLSSDVTINIDVSREYREMVEVDETEYTDNISITTESTPLKDYLSNYDRLFAYEITSISVSDSVKVNDDWRQAGSLGDIYYVDKVSGGTQSSPVTMTVSYKKVNYPNYRFSTAGIAPTVLTEENLVDSVMDLINVVPNPYYAYSTYEGVENGGQLDTRVRITNLPDECVISIYTINGSLIKQLNKDSQGSASIDWDLKNQKGIPIASGAYIINVSVPSLGKERNLKWFGVLRPIDLDTF
ncbi:MAG: hypothetical protein P8I29_00215 [Flavobacteriales bacterium]|nr:hypothetical protein [Flavobacteriales bacterium]